jgi:membrane protease YdiL (CAAX protease family)
MKRDSIGLMFALVFPTVSSWGYFEFFAGRESTIAGANRSTQAAWIMGKLIQFAFPLLWVWLVEKDSVRPSKPTFAGLRLGLGFGILVFWTMVIVYVGFLRQHPLMVQASEMVREKARGFGTDTPQRYIAVAAFLSIVHSLLEEYYWRWFVFGGLRKHVPYAAAVVVSALGFMAYHVINLAAFFPFRFWTVVAPLSACIAVGGMVWAWLYDRSGSIYAPWLSHLLVDVAVFSVGYDLLFVRGQ